MARTTVAFLGLAFAGFGFSQATNPAPAFDAASVRIAGPFQPGQQNSRGGPGTTDPTRFTYPFTNMLNLVMRAYGVRPDQVFGPAWIKDFSDDSTMFAVTATMPPNTSREQFNLMLQNLLAERFHLALHHEPREFPGYELVVADGGAKIKEYVPGVTTGPCPDGGACFDDVTGFPVLRPNSSRATRMPRIGGGWGMIRSTYRMPMDEFASGLGTAINEGNGVEMTRNTPRVSNKTGLRGTYEFTLGFAGLIVTAGMPGGDTAESSVHVVTDPGEVGPTIFNALDKQLGLRLVKTKNVSVDVLVIDHVDKVPTEN